MVNSSGSDINDQMPCGIATHLFCEMAEESDSRLMESAVSSLALTYGQQFVSLCRTVAGEPASWIVRRPTENPMRDL